ncbi:MAG: flagellar biosynthetic protein FliR [Candidatus Krumholzibacteriia bacterium]
MQVSVDSRLLLLTLVIAARVATMLALAPAIDRRAVPVWWRLAIGVPLAWALAPTTLTALGDLPTAITWPLLVLEALNSLVVGALLAFAANLVLAIVRYAGALIGMQIGFAIVNAYDPQSGSQVSIIAHLYYLLTALLFFTLDVHLVVIRAIVLSVQLVPPFSLPDLSAGSLIVLRAYGDVFSVGLQAAAPVTLVLLLVSAAMGVIVKTAPQIHVLVVGFPVKIAVGLAVLGSSLVFFRGVVERTFAASGDLMARILGALT